MSNIWTIFYFRFELIAFVMTQDFTCPRCRSGFVEQVSHEDNDECDPLLKAFDWFLIDICVHLCPESTKATKITILTNKWQIFWMISTDSTEALSEMGPSVQMVLLFTSRVLVLKPEVLPVFGVRGTLKMSRKDVKRLVIFR